MDNNAKALIKLKISREFLIYTIEDLYTQRFWN